MYVPVFHGIGVSETLYDLSHSGSLLTNGNVNAVQLLTFFSCIVKSLLVDDGVDGDGSFASLTITNDQLTLSTTNGYQGIDGFDASLGTKKGLFYQNLAQECMLNYNLK